MENSDRNIRKLTYNQFYTEFGKHKTTLGSLYAGSVKNDCVKARIRGFESARAASLFSDNVSGSVYDNLVSTIHGNLAPLHKYYALHKRLLGLDKPGLDLRHYDVYAPIITSNSKNASRITKWDEAVDILEKALSPLGDEYVNILCTGLRGRWADRYENKGKRSGAFSSGSYTSAPYILMNYKDDSVRDISTLAHEGGHSMHSYYSALNNPFMQYGYTIFEAEVASTFNEELLFRYLCKNADSPELRLYYVNKRADDILATLYRQTMFAEFEDIVHKAEERGEALTTEYFRSVYRKLLETYFGHDMVLEDLSDLEGLRIPHFYNAFYVYKYATGVSASLALAERVLSGGTKERDDYYAFLKSGGSRFPIDSLKIAGVDMTQSGPVVSACGVFAKLVDELEALTTKQ
jgi:oligoendopeptidase F